MTDPSLLSPEDRLTLIEDGLREMRHLAAALPGEQQALHAIHVEEELSRIGRVAGVLLAFVIVGVAGVGAVVWTVNNILDQNRQAIECLLAEMAEHRITNEDLHDRVAREIGVPPTDETVLPGRLDASVILRTCEPFYPEQEVGGDGGGG